MTDQLAKFVNRILALRWKLVLSFFLIGLGMRCIVFIGAHEEGDELIYMNLVDQLDQGRGYTLHRSALVEQGIVDRSQYDRPLFFHPPGGIVLNWLFYGIFGIYGFPLVQVFSYFLFFWSMMLLADSLGLLSSAVGMVSTAALSAFSPIMAHVTTKFWLDGPLLAFATLAAALFARGLVRKKPAGVLAAGLVLGFASLIKAVAFLILPGAALMGWFLIKRHHKPARGSRSKPDRTVRLCFRALLLFVIPALIVQVPWEVWQWIVCGSPFPDWAGKPTASLLATNGYVYYLTVNRPPWVYLTLTPRILWTLVPSLGLFALAWKKNSARFLSVSLLIWICAIVIFHVGIGYCGYSKVLRYLILITPPSVLLCAQLLQEAVDQIRNGVFAHAINEAAIAIVALTVLAVLLEMAAGTTATIAYKNDLIFPLLGRFY